MPALETMPTDQKLQQQAQAAHLVRLEGELAQWTKKREAVQAELALVEKTLTRITEQLQVAHAQT